MQLLVTMQALGRKRPVLTAVPFVIASRPGTLRQLILACVAACVCTYNARIASANHPMPISADELPAMELVGKMAFGVSYGETPADLVQAADTAIQAFEDGLVRVFLGQEELTDLDTPLTLKENDAVTFIRLTFLTGGICWRKEPHHDERV